MKAPVRVVFPSKKMKRGGAVNGKIVFTALSISLVALCSCFFISPDKAFAWGPPQVTWTGAVSTDWGTAGNWVSEAGTEFEAHFVPDIFTITIIPDTATTPNDPSISNGAVCSYVIIEADGVLNGNGQTITVKDYWSNNNGGVFNAEGGTILFSGSASVAAFIPGTSIYNNIEINKTDADFHQLSIAGTLDLIGNLMVTAGDLILSEENPAINLAGNLTIRSGAVYTRGTGVLTFNGTAPSVFTDQSATAQNIGKVVVNKTSSTETNNKLTLASSLTCDTLTVDGTSGQADTLDLSSGGFVLTLANAGATANVFSLNGSFISGIGVVKFTATNSAGNVNIPTATYSSLELAGAGTYDLAGTTTLNRNLIIGIPSTLFAGTNTLNIGGNLLNGGTFTADTSTVNLTGTGQIISGNTAFYNLTKEISAADTLTFTVGSTTTVAAGGTLTLKGDSRSNRLSLVSNSPETEWYLAVDADATYDFDFLDVQDSNATVTPLVVINSLDSGRNTNWTISNNTAATATTPGVTVSSNVVTIRTTVGDIDHDNTSLKIEYSIDNGATWLDPYLASATAAAGMPTLNNAGLYQVSAIGTAADNALTVVWDSKDTRNEAGAVVVEGDLKIRITPFDALDIGVAGASSAFAVDNRGAAIVFPAKPDISYVQLTLTNGVLHLGSLPDDIVQIAVARTDDFAGASWEDIGKRDELLNSFGSEGKLYIKFRTQGGAVSDTILYEYGSTASGDGVVLSEGDIVKTADSFDVYIIKYKNGKQYKRLILSPSVFQSYIHLNWANLKTVSRAKLDGFTTSNLVKETTDTVIYVLTASGDTGERRALDTTLPYDADSVYEINATDLDSYVLVK